MGNRKKIDKWLPADFLRIKAFARTLITRVIDDDTPHETSIAAVQNALAKHKNSIDVSNTTLRKWLAGEDHPSDSYAKLIENSFSGCTIWLHPSIDSSPMLRFLCALDVWGSSIDSHSRTLITTSSPITTGTVLNSLAKRWGSTVANKV